VITYYRWNRWAQCGAILIIATAAISATGCTRTRSGQGSREAEQLLAKVAAAYQGLQSFSERTTIRTQGTSSGDTVSSVAQTHFHYRQPNMIYYKATGRTPLVWVCDGKRLITYAPEAKSYRQTDAPPGLTSFFRMVRFDNPGLNELALLAGRQPEGVLNHLRLGKDVRIEGAATRSVSGDIVSLTHAGKEKVEARQTLWIDTKTYMIRRNLVVVKRGNETTRWDETMHEVRINPDLSDDEFKWTPPPGASRAAPRARPALPPPQRP
jgi:outer membrane lipoprotein-sorting protein